MLLVASGCCFIICLNFKMSHETIIIYMCRYVYYVFFDTFIPTPSVHSFPCQFFITDVSIEKKKRRNKNNKKLGVSTHLKNMLVKLDHFPQVEIKIKRKPPPRQRSQKIVKPKQCRPHGVENRVLYLPKFAS